MEKLLAAAVSAKKNAYAPYSGFKVGAAVLGASGRIYTGVNVENASYGLSNCAERTAIFNAMTNGERKLTMLAVVADTLEPVAPCGACRQVMSEFGIQTVIMANGDGQQYYIHRLETLLPHSFGPQILNERQEKE